LGEFELVKKKIAEAAADIYAMESATYHTAALIDRGAEDYMIETAMIKVFASDQLWRITNDCLQVWGGAGFFTDQPFERLMRDARLNMIGEGANDVLRCFIAAVGLRHLGKDMLKLTKSPWRAYTLLKTPPPIPIEHEHLRFYARKLSKHIAKFSWACEVALIKFGESIIDRQYIQARIGDIATELFMSSCVYSRLTGLLLNGTISDSAKQHEIATGMLYLRLAETRNESRFAELKVNLDQNVTDVANHWLKGPFKNWVLIPEKEIDPERPA
jgi:alkylation response protein AidB-like acyl-CoA dehydrogenase